jgi:hypothetical protein
MTTTNKSNSTAPFSITTKEVKSLWSHIVNPDTHFDKELGWLKITFLLPEADAKELNAVLLEQHQIAVKEFKADGKKVKVEHILEGKEQVQEDGTTLYEFQAKLRPWFKSKKDGKTKIYNRVQVIDSALQPMKLENEIGRGSTIRVKFKCIPYHTPTGCGITPRLHAIQILNLVEYASNDDHGFTVVEEGFVAKDQSTGSTTSPPPSSTAQTEMASAADF